MGLWTAMTRVMLSAAHTINWIFSKKMSRNGRTQDSSANWQNASRARPLGIGRPLEVGNRFASEPR